MADENQTTENLIELDAKERKSKRNLKDTVFADLFSQEKYLMRLYKALHPEDDITADMISIITLASMLVGSVYNDLGFMIGNRLIILVECQSTWTENILVRFLMYIAQSYLEYTRKNKLNIYGSKKLDIPKAELYVIYTGNDKIDKDYITLSEAFFNGERSDVNIGITVIQENRYGGIIDEYITFAKVLDEQIKKHGRTRTAILAAIRICRDKDVLAEYLTERETEVCDIMIALFEQEEVMKAYRDEIETEAEARGEARGAEKEKVSIIQNLMETMKFTIEQAMEAMKIPTSDYEKYKSLIARSK